MNLLKFLLPNREPSGRLFRVRITAPATGRPWHEEASRPLDKGETVDVDESTAAALIDARQAESLGLVGPNGQLVPKQKRSAFQLPAAAQSVPLPDGWASLPAEFHNLWKLTATRQSLVENVNAAATMLSGFSGYSDESQKSKVQLHLESCREALQSWDKAHGGKLGAALGSISRVTLGEIERLNELHIETRSIALELFALRIAPLDLPEHKVQELFCRSGLSFRYGLPLFPVSANGYNTISAPGGQIVFEDGPEQVASLFRIMTERRIEADHMLAKAKADLAAARAAVGEPAKTRRTAVAA